MFCAIGVFSLKNTEFDIYFMALFGVLGYVFTKLDCEPAPMLLAFILGPMMEEYLRRAMLLSRGDPMVFFTTADQRDPACARRAGDHCREHSGPVQKTRRGLSRGMIALCAPIPAAIIGTITDHMIIYRQISTHDPEYEQEKDLRNRVLRSPLGLMLSAG